MSQRIKRIRALLKKKGLGALFVTFAQNISYITGSISRDSFLLISSKNAIYFTDSRYTEEAKDSLGGDFEVRKVTDSAYRSAAEACIEQGIKKLGFEERYLSCAGFRFMRQQMPKGLLLVPTRDLVEQLRQIKDESELKLIRRAVRITMAAQRFAKKLLKPGMRELEVAAEIERFIRYQGALGPAFEIIVASGPNSSHPHHITSSRKIRLGEPVLIDMGVDVQGYKSDLTRTYFLGRITPLYRRIYAIVRQANLLAIKSLKIGAHAGKIDGVARDYITKEGFGHLFGHNLGHGVGLEVHEAPRFSRKEEIGLKKGMVFTIEPGIYLPHKFGVRIEDMVILTGKGVELVSGSLNK